MFALKQQQDKDKLQDYQTIEKHKAREAELAANLLKSQKQNEDTNDQIKKLNEI